MQAQQVIDSSGTPASATAAFFSWITRDAPVALFGVSLSTILIGFSGVILIISILPKPTDRPGRTWMEIIGYTVASAVLPKLVLHQLGLDDSYVKGISFLVGMCLPLALWTMLTFRVQFVEALTSWFRRGR